MAAPSTRQIVRTIRDDARRHDLLRSGPLVLAVSGGTDSTALALILAELRDEFGLVLHVAHFDHRARPAASAEDAAYVADLANHVGALLRVGRAERAPKNEDEARIARYAFLRRVAADLGASAVATGHTRDDQAETVLLHLVRGSGLAGLAGMRPARDGIVRPLLPIGRAETAAICAAAGITPREDETNASLVFARNRVRLRVLPELERLNPRVREAIARLAEAAAAVEDGVAAAGAVEQVDLARELKAGGIDLARLPAGRARSELLARAWRAATGRTLSAKQRAAMEELVRSTAGSRRLDLPGGVALREYARLRLGERSAQRRWGPIVLRRGASTEWHGWRIDVDVPRDGLPYAGTIAAGDIARLVVRARRPGDRLAGSRRKLQDLFVNAKIPASQRDAWPVVTLDEGVLWLPGLTPPPRTGRVPIAAGPVGDDPTRVAGSTVGQRRVRQVASNERSAPHGGKRGRP